MCALSLVSASIRTIFSLQPLRRRRRHLLLSLFYSHFCVRVCVPILILIHLAFGIHLYIVILYQMLTTFVCVDSTYICYTLAFKALILEIYFQKGIWSSFLMVFYTAHSHILCVYVFISFTLAAGFVMPLHLVFLFFFLCFILYLFMCAHSIIIFIFVTKYLLNT